MTRVSKAKLTRKCILPEVETLTSEVEETEDLETRGATENFTDEITLKTLRMTSITMLGYEINGHHVSIPTDSSIQWVDVDYETFQRNGTHLIQYDLVVYELNDMELTPGKDYTEWSRWVNEPVEFEEWRKNLTQNRSPRQLIIDGNIYQVKDAHLCWPRPIVYLNGVPVARIRDREVVWLKKARRLG